MLVLARIRNLSRLTLAVAAALWVVTLVGCSGSSGTDGGPLPQDGGIDAGTLGPSTCTAQFSGDYSDSFAADGGCGGLVSGDGGYGDGGLDWQLSLTAYSQLIMTNTQVLVDLGPSPSVGAFNSDTVASWSAIAITPATMCEFSAGNLSVPNGSFQLNLTSIGGLTPGGVVPVHGTLSVIQSVEEPPGSVCGVAGNEETVQFSF